MNKKYLYILIAIVIIAGILRVFKITSVPPSLNWDEAAAAYNAFTIKNWGKDEWGDTLPLVFTSFRDDKHPVHIYITSIFYLFLGVNDFTTRLPSAIFGSLTILFIYLLANKLFNNRLVAFLSAIFLALSVYHIHYSRGLWEANFALFFFIAGFALFFHGLERKNYLLPLAFGFFGVSLLSYHSAKIVVFLFVPLLVLLYTKELFQLKKLSFISVGVFLFFIFLLVIEPRLLGLARANQTKFSSDLINETILFQNTGNEYLGQLELSLKNYKEYFSLDYLVFRGDQNPRGFIGDKGQFSVVVVIFSFIGIFVLFSQRKFKELILLLFWLLIAPFPGAISTNIANSTRSIFMIGPPQLLASVGVAGFSRLAKNKKIEAASLFVILACFIFQSLYTYSYYLINYPRMNPHDWQYGMKQIVQFVEDNPDYHKVYMTKERSQPYIFFLYYLQYPLPELLSSLKYDQNQSKSYNTIESFDKYNFGNWDPIESPPIDGQLYIVTPSQYSGLRYKDFFKTQKPIEFPGQIGEAFYIVSTY